jgi:predicted RNA-binding Zn-ribbon protein involved in translation (DUF1610 family)
MLFALEATASVLCPDCNARSPVPGLRDKITCASCTAPIDIAALAADVRDGGIRYPFGAYYDAPAEAFLFGYGRALKDIHDSDGTPMKLSRKDPKCSSCDSALPAPTIGQPFFCPSCGDEIAVRAPDDVTRLYDPRIHYVMNDAFGRGAAPSEKRAEGAALVCGNCGGELVADGKKRALACGHCKTRNFIGDAAWVKLHPRPSAHVFYIVYDVSDVAAARRFHAGFANVAMHYGLTDEERAKVEQYGDRCKER